MQLIFLASDDATAGSVIKNADRISAFSRGVSHLSCCCLFPYRQITWNTTRCGRGNWECRPQSRGIPLSLVFRPPTSHPPIHCPYLNPSEPTSMLPVSGAEQLQASGARKERPVTYVVDGCDFVMCREKSGSPVWSFLRPSLPLHSTTHLREDGIL